MQRQMQMPCQYVAPANELPMPAAGAPVSGAYYQLYTYPHADAPLRPMSPSPSPLDADPLYALNRLQYPFGPTRQGHYPMATFVNRSQSNSRNASRAATPNLFVYANTHANAHSTLSRQDSGGALNARAGPPEGTPAEASGAGPAPIEVVVTSAGCSEQEKASQGTNSSNGSGALALFGSADVRPPHQYEHQHEPDSAEAAATTACANVFPLSALPPMPPLPVLPGISSAVVGRRPITPRSTQSADADAALLQTQSQQQQHLGAASGRPTPAPKPTAVNPIPCHSRVRSPLPAESSASALTSREPHSATAFANGSTAAGMSKWFDRLNDTSQV